MEQQVEEAANRIDVLRDEAAAQLRRLDRWRAEERLAGERVASARAELLEVEGRRQAYQVLAFLQKHAPGYEDAYIAGMPSAIGVRETRRIVGEYELNYDDYLARRQFPDQIAVFNKAVDIHVYDDSEEEYARFSEEFRRSGRLEEGECFGLPYGILVPTGWSNLWTAGRCNSSDVQVHSVIRVQPVASMMGQAAGIAGAMSAGQRCDPRALDYSAIRKLVETRGAKLEVGS